MTLSISVFKYIEHQKMRVLVNARKPVYSLKYKRSNPDYRISHVTFYSAGNAGDTVLSACIRDLFDADVGRISWSLIPITKQVNKEYIERLNTNSAVVIGGHGAFMPDTNENQISGWEWACSQEQYGQISAPLIVFAAGYNYFTGQERKKIFEDNIETLVSRSAFFGLRNNGSVREIQSFIDDSLKSKVVYQPCPTMISRKIYPCIKKKEVTRQVAFNVALDRAARRMGNNTDLILGEIAKAMKKLTSIGYDVHFITHCAIEIAFIDYLKKFDVDFKFHSASSWGAEKLIDFYYGMDVVIGMRGHGIWVPFGVNCHIISLGNQKKTKWFLEDINSSDWFIDINEHPENLCDCIMDKFVGIHETNGKQTTERLIYEQNRLYKITENNMHKIRDIITGGICNVRFIALLDCFGFPAISVLLPPLNHHSRIEWWIDKEAC